MRAYCEIHVFIRNIYWELHVILRHFCHFRTRQWKQCDHYIFPAIWTLWWVPMQNFIKIVWTSFEIWKIPLGSTRYNSVIFVFRPASGPCPCRHCFCAGRRLTKRAWPKTWLLEKQCAGWDSNPRSFAPKHKCYRYANMVIHKTI